MNEKERRTALRVGIFLSLGVAALVLAVFLLGSKGGLFESKSTLFVHFDDISGLVAGAPVRLAGLDVGTVHKITFSDDLSQRQASVELSIKDRVMPRVREDSRAVIDSKGLLGDKLVNISIGSSQSPQLQDGGTLQARPSFSIEQMIGKVDDVVGSVKHVTDEAGTFLEGLAEPQVRTDLQRILHSTAGLMEGVEQGDGFAHRLIYDREYAEHISGILAETQRGMAALRGAIEHVQGIADSVRTGSGTLHALIYDKSGSQALEDLRLASAELAALVHAVRSEPGLLHTLIYDEKSGEMLKEWNDFSQRVNRLSKNVEQGRGTLGGLIVDPSVYEDLKSVLGNIERNVLFKALIRYTIKEDELKRPATLPNKKTNASH
jgi:phospholipid/cholesterol/gamma-HCH transport system substrate-binding protein